MHFANSLSILERIHRVLMFFSFFVKLSIIPCVLQGWGLWSCLSGVLRAGYFCWLALNTQLALRAGLV